MRADKVFAQMTGRRFPLALLIRVVQIETYHTYQNL